MLFCVSAYLLLLSGDVELNPGPPRRAPAASQPAGPAKGAAPTKEDQLERLESKRFNCYEIVHAVISYDAIVNDELVDVVKDQEGQLEKLEKTVHSQKREIESLKETIERLLGFDDKVSSLTHKVDAITGIYDDLHEKMHEIDKTRKNNLLFYGIKPDFLPEIQSQLEQKVHEIIRNLLQISRDIPITKITRMMTGPEVRGCRPVLVNFAYWKDREECLTKSKLLRGTNIYVTEDLSRKMREHRHELVKYMRQVRSRSPNKRCAIRYDKLYVDNTPYVFDEERNQVVRYTQPEQQRPLSRNNYSTLNNESFYSSGGSASAGLIRSTSVPAVNGGEPHSLSLHSSMVGGALDNRAASGGSRTSLGGRRMDYASTESLQLGLPSSGSMMEEGRYSPLAGMHFEDGSSDLDSPRQSAHQTSRRPNSSSLQQQQSESQGGVMEPIIEDSEDVNTDKGDRQMSPIKGLRNGGNKKNLKVQIAEEGNPLADRQDIVTDVSIQEVVEVSAAS